MLTRCALPEVGVQVKCAPSATESKPLLTQNSPSRYYISFSASSSPSLGSSTHYTLYTRINNIYLYFKKQNQKKQTHPQRIFVFSVLLRDNLLNICLVCTIPVVCLSHLLQMQSCPSDHLKLFKYIVVYDLLFSLKNTLYPCHTDGYRLLIYMVTQDSDPFEHQLSQKTISAAAIGVFQDEIESEPLSKSPTVKKKTNID